MTISALGRDWPGDVPLLWGAASTGAEIPERLNMLPQRRQRLRSGIARARKRQWPKHEKWVRGHCCCVPGCQGAPIEFAHLRLGAKDNGTGIKPPSWFGISLCFAHHREAHQDGEMTFQRRHGIDWLALANEFVRRSPDAEMRAAMRQANV